MSETPSARTTAPADPAPQRSPSRLWVWFVAAFVLQLAAWIAWFVIASQHKVAEVPLAHSPGRS